MTRFNKKQKIAIGIVITIIVIVAIFYSYKQENNFLDQTENLEIEENTTENEEKAKTNEETKEMIIVHISGAVQNEGIVELEVNSRVADAIEKAGGLKENAYMDEINLAYLLEDGEKIHIPTIEEQKEKEGEEGKKEEEIKKSWNN